ncbi:SPASM domain-containing protein [Patescibacteria group bacterium]|nr:SPASM domain-containing protein [Patescibacteria group bacterium]
MKILLQTIEKRFKLIAVFLLALILIAFFDKALAIGLMLLIVLTGLTFWIIKKLGLSRKYLVMLLLIALAIQLSATLFIHYANFQPLGITGDGDFNSYHEEAVEMSLHFKEGNFSMEGFKLSHYYTIVIGVVYTLTLPEMIVGQLFGVWLSVLAIIFVYLIVIELGGSEKWAFFTGLITIAYPSFLFYSSLLLKDTLVIPFALLTMLLTLKLIKSFSWRNFLFFVVSLSIAFHFRYYIGYALLFAFLFSWLLLARLSSIKRKIVYSIIIIIILGFLPMVLRGHGFYGINIFRDSFTSKNVNFLQERAYNPSFPVILTGLAGSAELAEFAEPIEINASMPLINNRFRGFASTWDKEEVNPQREPLRFLTNQLKYFGYVLLGPFPWQMRYSRHLFALFELIPWYILLFFICRGVWESIKSRNKLILPLIIFSILALGVMALFLNNFGIITRIRIPIFMTLLCLIPLGFKSKVPTLTAVAIEINSACNRRCAWCPNHTNHREVKFLDEKVFFKAIDELRAMNFRGKITFNLYNEPLLDERLLGFISYVKKNIPLASQYLNTNGDLLNLDIWEKLRKAGLDYANISQYDGKINENIEKILKGIDLKEKKHFRAFVFDQDSICNRGGLLKSKREIKVPLKKYCSQPFYQLCIDYKGKVVLCCNDYHGAVVMGDVRNNSIEELWGNGKFRHYRKELLKRNRSNLKLCDVCDS